MKNFLSKKYLSFFAAFLVLASIVSSAHAQTTTNQTSSLRPTVNLTASPASNAINELLPGTDVTLSWSSTNMPTDASTTCSATGDWNGTYPTSGSVHVDPNYTSTYTMTCINAVGSASASVLVSVGEPGASGYTTITNPTSNSPCTGTTGCATGSNASSQTTNSGASSASQTTTSSSIPPDNANQTVNLDYNSLVKCDGVVTKGEASRQTECNFASLFATVNSMIKYLFYISAPLAVILFAWGGLLYLSGVPGNIDKAKKIFWAVGIGFGIMLIAWLGVSTLVTWFVNSNFGATSLIQS